MSNRYDEIKTIDQLNVMIQLMEKEQEKLGLTIKKQALVIADGMRPINMIKNTLNSAIANNTNNNSNSDSPIQKGTTVLLSTLLGGVNNQFIKKTLTNVLSAGITAFIATNPGLISNWGSGILNFLRDIPGKIEKE
jgi:hypothetical protein